MLFLRKVVPRLRSRRSSRELRRSCAFEGELVAQKAAPRCSDAVGQSSVDAVMLVDFLPEVAVWPTMVVSLR